MRTFLSGFIVYDVFDVRKDERRLEDSWEVEADKSSRGEQWLTFSEIILIGREAPSAPTRSKLRGSKNSGHA